METNNKCVYCDRPATSMNKCGMFFEEVCTDHILHDNHDNRLYLDLHGAREKLCRAQVNVPVYWRSDLQAALDHIDQVGSAVCPNQWSEHNQPEYPELKSP